MLHNRKDHQIQKRDLYYTAPVFYLNKLNTSTILSSACCYQNILLTIWLRW